MRFSDLLDAARSNPLDVTIPAEWGQGRATFGGLVVALQYEALRAQVPADRPLRSLAITFVGPVEPEVAASYHVEVLREGNAVSQLLGRVVQNGEVATVAQSSFGAARESQMDVATEPAPAFKHWDDFQWLPYIKGLTHELMPHLAMAWSFGGLPFNGNNSRDLGGWVRLRGDVKEEALTEAHILALVDAWPPALLPHLSKPAPGSTLTWTIECIQPLQQLTTLDWCQYYVNIEHARDGYGHAAAALWSPTGELIAISRQSVVVFA
ncbi:thioesterase family protein [Corynebacterium pseudodiphtheriticum]|nr:thioesterase family protein [Corynebacterium pseudodiphtheriticum]